MNKAVIMAGGFGTRLRPVTCTTIKPMVPVMNKPMMTHIVELLKKYGLKDILSILYFQPEQVTSFFADGSAHGVKMSYVSATEDYGTAGSVGFSRKHLKEPFIVISGDVLTDFDLARAIEYHKEKKAMITIVLTRVENPLQYGVVITDRDGRITRFLEKPSWGEVFSDTVNTGIYIIEPEALKYIPEGKEFDFSKDLFPLLLKNKEPIFGYIADGYWKDIGDLSEYLLAHRDVLEGRVDVNIPGTRMNTIGKDVITGENTVIEDRVDLRGGVVLGKNCLIKRGASIANSVLGDNCIVETNAKISGSIIWNDCYVGQNVVIKEAIIGKQCRILNNAYISEGVVVADECHIGESSMLKANIKIWPHKVVDAGSTLSTSLVWGEKWNKYLFGASGISGLGNIEITPEFAAKVGAACGAFFGKQANIATSRDSHKTSRLINRALISGILSCGCNVHDLQVMPPPVSRYQLSANNHKCCIHTRKSAFDPKLIEIKFYDSNGMALSVAKQKSIERFFFREDFARAGCDETGTIHFPHRTVDIYREGLLKFIDEEAIRQTPFKIVIDYAFGASSIIFPQILGQLGVDAVSLNAFADEKRVTQDPQMFSASLRQLSNIVQSLKADFGVMFDASCEKIYLVDETGRILTDDMLLSIMCYLTMKTAGGKTAIAVPVIASKIIEDMAAKFGCKVVRTKTMLRNMMEAALAENVLLVGDGVGSFGFPAFQPASDGLITLAKLLEMLAVVKKPLSEIEKEIPASRLIKVQLPCPWECKGTVMRNLIEDTKNLKTDLIDGVKIYFDNQDWILIIPDPDRPFFHIYVETSTEEVSNRLIKQYSDKIRHWQASAEDKEDQK
ncbi:MAG TPA: nucleotidyltransferase [Candidatus Wallbacteria bacterium]|nr:nucleotidyltransferase [Candidatus Wallbacteria bacterium]